jgi:hypothetical protein
MGSFKQEHDIHAQNSNKDINLNLGTISIPMLMLPPFGTIPTADLYRVVVRVKPPRAWDLHEHRKVRPEFDIIS